MVNYRRNFVPGGTFFFTVTLADRRSSLLVDYIGLLRNAFRTTYLERPFKIETIGKIANAPPSDSACAGSLLRGIATRSPESGGAESRKPIVPRDHETMSSRGSAAGINVDSRS
jgi:hypothetical protein